MQQQLWLAEAVFLFLVSPSKNTPCEIHHHLKGGSVVIIFITLFFLLLLMIRDQGNYYLVKTAFPGLRGFLAINSNLEFN